MAVTAAVTPIRIVCANTLGAALHRSEHGVGAQRTFRFRNTGDLQAKFVEARTVLGMTIDYKKQFKELADRLARESITPQRLEHSVLGNLWVIDEDTGHLARRHIGEMHAFGERRAASDFGLRRLWCRLGTGRRRVDLWQFASAPRAARSVLAALSAAALR